MEKNKLSEEKKDSELKEHINACYQKILNRPADPSGLDHFFNSIKSGHITLETLPEKLKDSEEFKQHQKMLEMLESIKKNSSKIIKPIFIIGVPRTGTTFIYRTLCAHPDLAWMSNLDLKNWIPPDEQKKLKEKYKKMKENNEPIPRNEHALFVFGRNFVPGMDKSSFPIEGATFWEKYLPSYKRDISNVAKNEVIKTIADIVESQKKPRFLNKAPQNSVRLFAIHECFPDAKFIYLVRDPKAVISSMLLRAKKQGDFKTGIFIKNPPEYEKLNPIQKWAWLYKEIMEAVHEFSLLQSMENFLTIKYEDLIAHPRKKFAEILKFCELKPSEVVMESIPTPRKNQTSKWKNTLNSQDVKEIFEILLPSLEKMNFKYWPRFLWLSKFLKR